MFQGLYTALVTPFLKGHIDYKSFESLLEFQVKNGVAGIVLCGTTGESPTLSSEEYEQLIRTCLEIIKQRVQVIVGTGSNSTQKSIETTRLAKRLGADAALVVSPYYNKPTQPGLYKHFSAIADAVDLPCVVYNIPSRTGVNITSDTLIALSKNKNICALKESSGDLEQAMQVLKYAQKGFTVLSGDDVMTLPLMSLGAHGVVSVLSNVFPKDTAELVYTCRSGNLDKARALHYKYLEAVKALFIETNPAPVKYALSLLQMCSEELRLPLCTMTEEHKKHLRAVLAPLAV